VSFSCGTLVPFAALALALAGAAESRATRHFDVHFRGTTAAAHAELLRQADTVASRVARDLGIAFPRTHVVVAGSRADFLAALPAGAELGEQVVGVAFPGERLIVVRNVANLVQVFTHEASHIGLYAAVPRGDLPRWFVEGFAAFQSGEGSIGRLSSLVRASVSGTLIPLAELERRFPARHDIADLAYAQSAELVSYLLGTYGRPPLQDLLGRLSRGQPFFEALSAAYGRGVAEIEAASLRDLRLRS
jgi:hypothetical protein